MAQDESTKTGVQETHDAAHAVTQDAADGTAPAATPAPATPAPAAGARKPLSDAAKRALAEAEARRAAIDAATKDRPKELDGRGGLEPVRYGDWEVGGIASDF